MSIIWGKQWARSPRRDRRVVEDGKFVELGRVQHPTSEPEPQEESALEIVTEFAGGLPVGAEIEVVNEISGTVFEEARYETAVEQEAGAGANVLPDVANGSSEGGLESVDQPNDTDSEAPVYVAETVLNPSISTAEGPSISEASQEELEPIVWDLMPQTPEEQA